MNDSIVIEDVGPISRVVLPAPPEGGVVELLGTNGSGKSTAIRTVQALGGAAKNADLTPRDGALEGRAEGFGVRLVVGSSRTTPRGELEALSIDADLDPSVLVDPGFKEETTNDRHRVVMLCRLLGVRADLDLFADLARDVIPGEDPRVAIRSIAGETTRATVDLPDMAAALKRDFEARARAVELDVATISGKISTLSSQYDGVNIDAPSDDKVLQAEVLARAGRLATLKSRVTEAARSAEARGKAREALAAAQQRSGSIDVEGAAAKLAAQEDALRTSDAAVKQAEARLAEARDALSAAERAQALARASVSAAREELRRDEAAIRDRDAAFAALESTAVVLAPEPGEIEEAESLVLLAQKAVEDGALVRHARAKKAEAESLLGALGEAQSRAARLREAAASCESVVARSVAPVAPGGLHIRRGRLMIPTEARGDTFFSELSEGERWRFAIPAFARALRARGGPEDLALMGIRQEAWEALDPNNKRFVDSIARDERVVIYTARATGDALRAQVFAETPEGSGAAPAEGEAS